MSTTHHTNDEADIPEAVRDRIPAGRDPTRTVTLRRRFRQRFNRRWRDARGDIRAVIDRNDALGVSDHTDSRTLDISDAVATGGERLRVPSLPHGDDAQREASLKDWLRRVIMARVVSEMSDADALAGNHWTADPLKTAYLRGLGLAVADARAAGVIDDETSNVEPTDVFTADRHQETLSQQQLRTYTDVEQAAAATLTAAMREAGDVLGGDPTARELADVLTDRLDAVGQTRTAVVAETRVVDTVNRAIIEHADSMGASRLGTVPEAGERRGDEHRDHREATWATAGDSRVCAICRSMAGRTATVEEIKRGDVERPVWDTHPRCRCRWVVLG